VAPRPLMPGHRTGIFALHRPAGSARARHNITAHPLATKTKDKSCPGCTPHARLHPIMGRRNLEPGTSRVRERPVVPIHPPHPAGTNLYELEGSSRLFPRGAPVFLFTAPELTDIMKGSDVP